MKPTKHCEYCNKPIWNRNHGYTTIRDSYMDIDKHFHSQCYEDRRVARLKYERDLAMLREINKIF